MSKNKNYSVWKCAFCEPLGESKEGYINLPSCPYTHGVYDRDRGCMSDQVADPGLIEYEFVGKPCHDCGVIYGNVHHVGYDCESCPVDCHGQFLGCGHDEDAKYLKGPNDSGKYHPGLLRQLTS